MATMRAGSTLRQKLNKSDLTGSMALPVIFALGQVVPKFQRAKCPYSRRKRPSCVDTVEITIFACYNGKTKPQGGRNYEIL